MIAELILGKDQFADLKKSLAIEIESVCSPRLAFCFGSPPWETGEVDVAVVTGEGKYDERARSGLVEVARRIGSRYRISIDGWCFPLSEAEERLQRIAGFDRKGPVIVEFDNWTERAYVPLYGDAIRFIEDAYARPLSGGPKPGGGRYKFEFRLESE